MTPRSAQQAASPGNGERIVRVGCPAHNCGGRCLLVAHVRDGRIVRLGTDDRPGDTLADPQLRACTRGRAYLRRQYHPDRLLYPLKRTGRRGEGKWARISWDEALDLVAGEMRRVKEAYGNGALFVPYGTGSYSQLNGSIVARRLMNLLGGCLGIYNSYSWAAINVATPTVYGTLHGIRRLLLLLGIVLCVVLLLSAGRATALIVAAFLVALAAQVLGRYLFYITGLTRSL